MPIRPKPLDWCWGSKKPAPSSRTTRSMAQSLSLRPTTTFVARACLAMLVRASLDEAVDRRLDLRGEARLLEGDVELDLEVGLAGEAGSEGLERGCDAEHRPGRPGAAR